MKDVQECWCDGIDSRKNRSEYNTNVYKLRANDVISNEKMSDG